MRALRRLREEVLQPLHQESRDSLANSRIDALESGSNPSERLASELRRPRDRFSRLSARTRRRQRVTAVLFLVLRQLDPGDRVLDPVNDITRHGPRISATGWKLRVSVQYFTV